MRIGSLFSGAGGLDIAVQGIFGGYIAWHSEIDPAASKVLDHHWPDTPNIGDLTCIDWDIWDEITPDIVVPVDVLCGGWPCQPFSIAGQQKGRHDDRALWPYVARAIRSLRPTIIVLENVTNVLAIGEFDRVAADLAATGYDLAWTCIQASQIGACHRRDRLFICAQKRQLTPATKPLHRAEPKETLTLLPTPTSRDHKGANQRADDTCLHGALISPDAHKYQQAIRRWETATRPAPTPTERSPKGVIRINPQFSEWMMGWPAGWVTDPDIGISRHDQLRIIGNGVVPQQASAAIQFLLDVSEVAA